MAKRSATRTAKKFDMPKKIKGLVGRIVKFTCLEMVEAWIEHDLKIREKTGRKNRALTRSNIVSKYNDMEAGAFVLTSQGLTIDWDTAIIDGQHTCHAMKMYFENGGKDPIELFVTEGENPDHFPFYDQGKNRSTSDVFGIDGIDFPKETAIAARLLWIRAHGKRIAGAGKVSAYVLKEFMKEFKGFEKSVAFIMNFGKEEDSLPCKDLISCGYAIALHYLMCNADVGDLKAKELADKFWTLLIEREGPKGSFPHKLVTKFIKIANDPDTKMTRDAMVDNVIFAFNCWVDYDVLKAGNPPKFAVDKGDKPTLAGYDGCYTEEEVEVEVDVEE